MKNDIDRKADELCAAYYEKFGTPYPLGNMHSVTVDEMFAEIETALKTGKPVKVGKPKRGVLY